MNTQTFDVHKNIQHLLEIKEYKTITDLVDWYSLRGHLDGLVSIFEALNVVVQKMETKNEAKTLYRPVIFPSINTLMERNMRNVAEYFFAPGEGVIAREIEMKKELKAVC